MVKMLPVPTLAPELFCGYQINWTEKTKGVLNAQTLYETDRDKAFAIYETKYCQWLLQPLANWCKQQEHLAGAQNLVNPARRQYIFQLHKIVATFITLPTITKATTAYMLAQQALPLLEKAMPGRSSKYLHHTTELVELYEMFCKNQQSASISGQTLAKEIPFT